MSRIILYILIVCLFSRCVEKSDVPQQNQWKATPDLALGKASLALYIGLDTLPTLERKPRIEEELNRDKETLGRSPYGLYLKGLAFFYGQERDSFAFYLEQSAEASPLVDSTWQRLITYTQLGEQIKHQRVASLDLMELLYQQLEIVNQQPSPLDYQLYDLLAKAYFLNKNTERSLHFTKLYYANHPFKSNRTIQTRFYDISFLLAAELHDREQAYKALMALEELLHNSKDEIALSRYYDMEARYYALIGQYDQALTSSKRYFDYNKKRNLLHPVIYNNLATSFERNNQLDSAIHYYKEGIALAQQMNIQEQNHLYGGLSNVYKRQGDYHKALVALDSSFAHAARLKEKMNANKLHELELQYQTKQKDTEISSLKAHNQLQEKTFAQQRWITLLIVLSVIGSLSYIAILYRQRLLKEKNNRLALHNKKMELEQRLLQVQLNPHFIYNAIANLQGFINAENKAKANRYLITLSKMIRNILELNRRDFITIAEDLSAIENYIQVQQMRYGDSFDYEITHEGVAVDELLIPPMLLQPFIENAIEHGFKNIAYRGKLHLLIEEKDDSLYLYIRDNGCGLTPSDPTAVTAKQSLSQIITQERLDALFTQEKKRAFFRLSPLSTASTHQGVEVMLCIPLIYC